MFSLHAIKVRHWRRASVLWSFAYLPRTSANIEMDPKELQTVPWKREHDEIQTLPLSTLSRIFLSPISLLLSTPHNGGDGYFIKLNLLHRISIATDFLLCHKHRTCDFTEGQSWRESWPEREKALIKSKKLQQNEYGQGNCCFYKCSFPSILCFSMKVPL